MTTTNKDQEKSYEEILDIWRKYFEHWKWYPDHFIDFIRDDDCIITLHFYQRIFLRLMFRYQKVFFTFTRGSAKSWTALLAIYLKCIFFPGINLFITAPQKHQAANIARENIEKIWRFFPILQNEVDIKSSSFQNDYIRLVFKNGSTFDVVQAVDSSRGGRRNGGVIEEIVDPKLKKDVLNEVVIPMMADDRIAMNGEVDKENEIHKFQYYVTTAGTRQSFAFEKLQEVMGEMARGESAFVLGSGYELPAMYHLDINHINKLKMSPTFNPLGFAREYESVWTGTSEKSLVKLEDLLACRVLEKAEFKASDKPDVKYVLAYDVARMEGSQNANCALAVFKLTDRGDGTYRIQVPNLYSFQGTIFDEQARFIKKKVNEYNASAVVIDINGPGVGLVDQLVREIDENPAYSVMNDDRYDKYKSPSSKEIIFVINSKSRETKDSAIHDVFVNMITNRRVQFLISESEAKAMIMDEMKKENKKKKKKQKNSELPDLDLESQIIADRLMPYAYTDLLIEEIMNLEYHVAGKETKVKQISRKINKDKFSAVEYGLYYIYLQEKKNAVKRHEIIDPRKFFLVSRPRF